MSKKFKLTEQQLAKIIEAAYIEGHNGVREEELPLSYYEETCGEYICDVLERLEGEQP